MNDKKIVKNSINPQVPVAQKVADEVVFRRFQGDLTDQIINLSPSRFHFSVGFYIKIMFWVRWFYSLFERMRLTKRKNNVIYTNQPLITSFYIKRSLFFAKLAISQRWCAIFEQRVRG